MSLQPARQTKRLSISRDPIYAKTTASVGPTGFAPGKKGILGSPRERKTTVRSLPLAQLRGRALPRECVRSLARNTLKLQILPLAEWSSKTAVSQQVGLRGPGTRLVVKRMMRSANANERVIKGI